MCQLSESSVMFRNENRILHLNPCKKKWFNFIFYSPAVSEDGIQSVTAVKVGFNDQVYNSPLYEALTGGSLSPEEIQGQQRGRF